jgi:hypothetical protein
MQWQWRCKYRSNVQCLRIVYVMQPCTATVVQSFLKTPVFIFTTAGVRVDGQQSPVTPFFFLPAAVKSCGVPVGEPPCGGSTRPVATAVYHPLVSVLKNSVGTVLIWLTLQWPSLNSIFQLAGKSVGPLCGIVLFHPSFYLVWFVLIQSCALLPIFYRSLFPLSFTHAAVVGMCIACYTGCSSKMDGLFHSLVGIEKSYKLFMACVNFFGVFLSAPKIPFRLIGCRQLTTVRAASRT